MCFIDVEDLYSVLAKSSFGLGNEKLLQTQNYEGKIGRSKTLRDILISLFEGKITWEEPIGNHLTEAPHAAVQIQ